MKFLIFIFLQFFFFFTTNDVIGNDSFELIIKFLGLIEKGYKYWENFYLSLASEILLLWRVN